MAKATSEELDGLHDMVAKYYASRMASGEILAPGELSAINTFLKNNDITADALESTPMKDLLAEFVENKESFFN